MARLDRSFTCIDIIRIWNNNLDQNEQATCCLLMAMVCAQRRSRLFLAFVIEMMTIFVFAFVPSRIVSFVARLIAQRVPVLLETTVVETIDVFLEPSLVEEAIRATTTTPRR